MKEERRERNEKEKRSGKEESVKRLKNMRW